MATQTAAPMNGKRSECSANLTLINTFIAIAAARMMTTMVTRGQSTAMPAGASFAIGEWRCCCSEAGMPKITSATLAAT